MMKLMEEFLKLHEKDLPKKVTYCAYRLMAGVVHRQDVKGGNWTALTTNEANKVLALLDIDKNPDNFE